MQHPFGALTRNFRLIRLKEFRGQQPAGPAGDGETWVVSGKILDELEWPSLEARSDQTSLLLFHKIHCGAVSIEKDKYMTPAHSLKTTRSSHSAEYHRHQTYSDALKNSFFPQTIPHWNSLTPSVANIQSTEGTPYLNKNSAKSFCVSFCCFVFWCFCFLFYQNFKINAPWRNAQAWAKPVR